MNRAVKEISAYMTVEISLLFPLIVSVLLCVIYFIFYSYNSTVAFQNSAICALYGKNISYMEIEESEQVNRMYMILEMLNEEQYIIMDRLRQEVAIDGKDVVVCQEGNINIPLLNPEIMSKLNFQESVKIKKQNNVFYLRQIRKVKNNET